ncbi:MAG TPA: hypothetical protein VFP00_08840, partial [Burkholderiales bacterium]|nr:hypothetical protein [Burkholderiales bacterium]
LTGLNRPGKAQLDYLGLLLLQAVVLFLWWPKHGITQVLLSQHPPSTLAALVMAVGVTTAYFALRAGAEEIALPGQRGLREWARAALPAGSILSGYIVGQLLHSLHLVALSSPLLLTAFTVSGGEWTALGWCLAAVLAQALFYRLCGAIAHLSLGQHRDLATGTARAIMLVVYVPLGLLAPVTSHLALAYRTLGEDVPPPPAMAAMPEGLAFVLIYAALSALAALALHRLLLREHGVTSKPDGAGIGKAFTG